MTSKRPVLKALRIIAPAVGLAVATLVPLAASTASALISTGPGQRRRRPRSAGQACHYQGSRAGYGTARLYSLQGETAPS